MNKFNINIAFCNIMKNQYTNEINKTLNSKIYYIPESNIVKFISKNYKVKAHYISNKENILNIITSGMTPLMYKKISTFLDDNYHKHDLEIFKTLYSILISMDFTENDATTQITAIKQKI